MLKTRIITAVVLLVVLVAVLASGQPLAFAAVLLAFLYAGLAEAFRLFHPERKPWISAALWTGAFAWFAWFAWFRRTGAVGIEQWLFLLASLFWLLRFAPSLKLGLPPLNGLGNVLLSRLYALALLAAFAAIAVFYGRSPVYLLSVLALVWVADIGAYFAGRALGKRKLAPSISPGKSWEGAIGGGIAVLVLASAVIAAGGQALGDTFPAHLHAQLGWLPTLAILALLVAFSIVGDLFESQLKRRAGVKDSGKTLPGHGGVLDRIDALVPALPMAAMIHGLI
jgi:phosphatidate cytidylyltransferase